MKKYLLIALLIFFATFANAQTITNNSNCDIEYEAYCVAACNNLPPVHPPPGGLVMSPNYSGTLAPSGSVNFPVCGGQWFTFDLYYRIKPAACTNWLEWFGTGSCATVPNPTSGIFGCPGECTFGYDTDANANVTLTP